MQDLTWLDATAQAELVRKGEVKPSELLEAAIERLERVNGRLNAVITPMYELARGLVAGAAAAALPAGPFRGVPFLLKDLLATYAGVRRADGSDFMGEYVPDHDSTLVARYKAAGLVTFGKTNTPEFGILCTTEPRRFGPTRNPWDTSRTTGGSSGGSAAAVAAGIVPMAHANDGGGSIRIPASCCGVFGLKPTRGRTTLGPDLGDIMAGLVHEHAVTRSVRDSAALLDAVAGPEVGDPYFATPPARPYLKEVGADPGPLRIGFTGRNATGVALHADCAAALQDAARLCAELGHHVEEAPLPDVDGQRLTQAFLALWAAGGAATVAGAGLVTGRTPAPEQFEALTWALYEMGNAVPGPQVLLGIIYVQGVARAFQKAWQGYDVVLTPTIAEPPVPLGTFDSPPDNGLAGLFRAAEFTPFTPLQNMTGQPAMSVPLYWNAAGLPIGTHFVGRYGDEATLFRLAAQLEQARPWAGRRPPVHA
ncbi:MAG TPA: amidase [Myxococcota bacterium]|jgi:amidase|nr:amidase [Myxococcota bacterium]